MTLGHFKARTRQSRFRLLRLAITISLPLFFIFRVILVVRHYSELDDSFITLAKAFVVGLFYDLSFLSYFLIPFVIYLWLIPEFIYRSIFNKILVHVVFLVCLNLLYLSMVSEWLFWDEFHTRFNFIALDYLVYTHEVFRNIIESYPLALLLSGIAAVSLLTYWLFKSQLSESLEDEDNFFIRSQYALIFLLFPALSYASIDQSLQEISDNRFVTEIAANGLYQFAAAFRNNEIDYLQFYAQGKDPDLSSDIKRLVSNSASPVLGTDLYQINRSVKAQQPERPLNVILLTVESLSANFFNRFGNRENITPYLDKLAKQSLLFTRFYATGTRTTRGLEALTLSVPPTPGQSIVKRPDNEKLFNLGRVFQLKGYDTVFLYGGLGYFDNMNAFFSGNGYRIIDETDFSKEDIHFKNAWGVSDGDLLDRTLKEADADYAQHKPFLFQIMTTSNHRPYTFPEGKIDKASGSGRSGAVKYTDYAIGQFIEQAKTKPWFQNTVFVIVADHCAGSARKAALPVENYHIPLLIYAPNLIQAAEIDTLSSQIDVAPTLLGLLNFNYDSQFYGKDILHMAKSEGRALISNYQKLGLFKEDKLVYLAPQQHVVSVDHSQRKPSPLSIEASLGMIEETMAYYQSANYRWTHRMSRYD
ncbi:LTA synthase family protein [Methylicorpusculum sp.]|uniref:LTA synthase family protein n=2 Tax=Methylicorpusculum sp. TaxID=2713644 RepID=UPI002730902D|nr:LTA synthase family protein [Methylicorpusculum sp.]MDP2179556.1 LTA synthase family protein [Methylicorpusculum sp.]MDP3527679.1 LTA synthase family protein [Methylicorpusculum sp.]